MTEKELNKKIKQKYNDFINDLTLNSIELIESNLKKVENFSPPADLKISQDSKYKIVDKKKGLFAVYSTYNLKSKKKGDKNGEFIISATYKFIYSSKIEINDEIFEIFSVHNLILHSWPYFRQFVQDMVSRAGLPPLTLDVLRV